jgi:D-amino-acid dehydrogenase
MEFSGNALTVSTRRVDSLLRAAGPLIEGYERVGEAWCGLRPMTPDGLPVVGRAPGGDDLYIAAGYGMLGITVSPTAATLLADEIVEGRPHPDLAQFSPARFARR